MTTWLKHRHILSILPLSVLKVLCFNGKILTTNGNFLRIAVRRGWMIFSFFKLILFLLIKFHCFFLYLIKYYNITYNIIVFLIRYYGPSRLLLFFMPTVLLSILKPLLVPYSSFFVLFYSCCFHV